jgi:hypothetical protein
VDGSGWAGIFSGKVDVTSNFCAGAKFFHVDHPLDPENQTLTHACGEGDEISQRLSSAGDEGCWIREDSGGKAALRSSTVGANLNLLAVKS